MLTIKELDELMKLSGKFQYHPGEIVLGAYCRGLLTKDECKIYALEIYGKEEWIPTWLKTAIQ